MLYSTVLVAVAAFAGFASAQNSTIPCCTVPVNTVPDDQKTLWCQAERNTCPEICGGLGQIASGGNNCDDTTLNFTCTCKNGTKPDMSLYQQSVPGQMCRLWFDTCINATGSDLQAQFQCRTDRDTKCGNLTTDGESASTSSASSTSTASQTGGGNAASATISSSSSTAAAATVLAMAREYGTPLFAGGMAALFGLAL